jgi:exopolysaccharide production protein ExoQ
VLAALTFAVVVFEVVRWVMRVPSPESCFYFGFLLFIAVRTYVEVELFGQYSFTWIIFVVAWVHARAARMDAVGERALLGHAEPVRSPGR